MTSFTIKNVRLFDGEKVVENASVLVEDGVITQIGHDVAKAGLPTISKSGHTLLPGLIDAHCHPYRESRLCEQAFRFGITTLMDMHNLHESAVLQKQWARERKDVPDVKSCHFTATIDGGWEAWVEKKLSNNEVSRTAIKVLEMRSFRPFSVPTYHDWPNVAKEEDAEPFVQRAAADGSDYIKLMHEGGRAIGIEAGEIVQTREAV
jgi:dihydroorotase-like cyclic amidohydrolase